jgi:Skp family chaperone for outer membrane proteins
MMKYLAPLIFALLFVAATACAANAQGETVPAPSAEDNLFRIVQHLSNLGSQSLY